MFGLAFASGVLIWCFNLVFRLREESTLHDATAIAAATATVIAIAAATELVVAGTAYYYYYCYCDCYCFCFCCCFTDRFLHLARVGESADNGSVCVCRR